jgi:signal transduction histidine kinase
MKRAPGLSIRARITIGSLVIAAVLFSIAAFFFRIQVQSILATTTETLLRTDAAPIITSLATNPGVPVDRPGEGKLIAVLDPNGALAMSSLPQSLARKTEFLATLDDEPRSVQAGRFTYSVTATTVPTGTGEWVVVTARNQEALALLLDQLTRALVIGAVVLVLGFGVASWLLTGAALRPVSRLREEAESLTAIGSSAQLPVPAGNDEVSELAITLNDFIARLRHSIDREKQVVSDASHELRTPLAVLKGQLELAHLNTGNAAALERDIVEASRTVDRLSHLATNLLELSKLDSEQAPPPIDWFALSSEITASVDRARMTAHVKDVEVEYEINGTDPTGRYALSRTNAGQLIDNLVSNAAAAMGGRGVVAVIHDPDDTAAHVRVVDTGPGLPEEFIPLALDRFSRPDDARGSKSGGSGLGLAIVRAIVERAGGTVSLRNTASGFSVEITLPRIRNL